MTGFLWALGVGTLVVVGFFVYFFVTMDKEID